MNYVPSRCLFLLTLWIQKKVKLISTHKYFHHKYFNLRSEDVFSKFAVAWLLHFSFMMTLLSASVFLKNGCGKENIFSKLEIY